MKTPTYEEFVEAHRSRALQGEESSKAVLETHSRIEQAILRREAVGRDSSKGVEERSPAGFAPCAEGIGPEAYD